MPPILLGLRFKRRSFEPHRWCWSRSRILTLSSSNLLIFHGVGWAAGGPSSSGARALSRVKVESLRGRSRSTVPPLICSEAAEKPRPGANHGPRKLTSARCTTGRSEESRSTAWWRDNPRGHCHCTDWATTFNPDCARTTFHKRLASAVCTGGRSKTPKNNRKIPHNASSHRRRRRLTGTVVSGAASTV
jgi:hypothetical protein